MACAISRMKLRVRNPCASRARSVKRPNQSSRRVLGRDGRIPLTAHSVVTVFQQVPKQLLLWGCQSCLILHHCLRQDHQDRSRCKCCRTGNTAQSKWVAVFGFRHRRRRAMVHCCRFNPVSRRSRRAQFGLSMWTCRCRRVSGWSTAEPGAPRLRPSSSAKRPLCRDGWVRVQERLWCLPKVVTGYPVQNDPSLVCSIGAPRQTSVLGMCPRALGTHCFGSPRDTGQGTC